MSREAVPEASRVKGWCPGAYRPMMSGDGLIVRVRPRMGRLTRDQVLVIAGLAQDFGSGIIDLTSRSNLQIRGVAECDHQPLLDGLLAAGLLDATPALEARRNVLSSPFPDAAGLTQRLHDRIVANLSLLPELPAKMGIALDTGVNAMLPEASADFRFERSADTSLILRADGAGTGFAVSEESASEALFELATWFVASGGSVAGRMRRYLKTMSLPARFQGVAPRRPAPLPQPGPCAEGYLLGAAFGTVNAQALAAVVRDNKADAMRITPWRMFLLEGVTKIENSGFIAAPDDPSRTTHACPGKPFCAHGKVETRSLAKTLSGAATPGTIVHVSGCSKGCAHPRKADFTVVGTDDGFNLVRAGAAWDEPAVRGLSAPALLKEVAR